MLFGLGVRDVIGLARETSSPARPIVVSGPRARELADGLARDGASSLVLVGGDPAGASACVVVVLDGELSAADEGRLRIATRAGVPVLAVLVGDLREPLPYVLPDDVVVVGDPDRAVPIREVAAKLAAVLDDDGPALAARLPVLREAVNGRRTLHAALGGAALVMFARGSAARPLLPVLALMQARTLRQLSVARGEAAPSSAPAEIATTVGPELAASLAVGLACRTLVRHLPVRGRLVEGLVAGSATFALASAGRYLRPQR